MDIIPDYQNDRQKVNDANTNNFLDFIAKQQQIKALTDTKQAYAQGLIGRAMLQQGYAPSQQMLAQGGYMPNAQTIPMQSSANPQITGLTAGPLTGPYNPQTGQLNPQQAQQAFQQFQQTAGMPPMNPNSPLAMKQNNHQDLLENQALTRVRMALTGRANPASVQQGKVQSVAHGISVLDQAIQPDGSFQLTPQAASELALNVNNVVTSSTQAADKMRQDLESKSLYGDLQGTLQYLSGKPKNSTPEELAKWYMDTLVRQGNTSQKLRDESLGDVKQLMGSGLEQSRQDRIMKMHYGTNINDLVNGSSSYKYFYGGKSSNVPSWVSSGFDYASAKKAGYSDDDIKAHLKVK